MLTMLLDLPTHGPCDLHGVTGHVCYFYTVSDDRCGVYDVWGNGATSCCSGLC